ncbi:glycosyltransferase involved in cell wall biosynthesis [Peribacillus deserti]|uniref:Glycosyltransferase involved in cell wall biosynthesis n=1 Tax=Peribacillus deserti TaxID=673318 RepID=A0ABS2QC45_9BACI|nr:glycosyltransferase family 2 protein [Peribacillus deserti]MBM7690738.1 glycosyltransferase involved in cell wall biosynthesis [Peribacillus deserti]
MSELVSIVIPVYNAAPYLDDCLRSAANQTYKTIEVIMINDGSTDHSEEILKKYEEADDRFTLYSQENHGLGYTRNKGIELSRGQYVFFLDADDELPKGALKALITAMAEGGADYAAGKVLRLTEDSQYAPKRHSEFNLYEKKEMTTIHEKPEMLQDSIACNKLWKREFLFENELFFTEGKYYEDLHMTLRAAVLAKAIAVTSQVVYLWRVRENENKPSITQQQMKLKNTQDRLSALLLNRDWLVHSKAPQRIISEHDLKSLLDVLRLHVIKYALVHPEERDEWQKEINKFLDLIPDEEAVSLPQKERDLYNLLKEKNYKDLLLFSQMYTDTETRPIVTQQGLHFELQGENKSYDVSRYLKPSITVTEINMKQAGWVLKGTLTIPKASHPAEGTLYGSIRNKNETIKAGRLVTKPTGQNHLYPYEHQDFEISMDPETFAANAVYDFYFRLDGKEPARVKFSSTLQSRYEQKAGRTRLSLYRTKRGNLSLQVRTISIKHMLKTMVKMIFR